MGTYNGLAMSRLWKVAMKDRKAFEDSIGKVLEWDFDRIVVAHGAVIERDGKRLLRGCLAERGFKF
jgi:hypothetical protein